MAFKPNYRRDRAERQRAARARTEEKQRKKEKAALRKARGSPSRRMRNKRPDSLEVAGRNTVIAAQRMVAGPAIPFDVHGRRLVSNFLVLPSFGEGFEPCASISSN